MTHGPVMALTAALMRLPGLGERSARRMVRHLLERDRAALDALAQALREVQAGVGLCERCRRWSTRRLCQVCEAHDANGAGDNSQGADALLVVEHEWMLDWWARARPEDPLTSVFVLHGQLSPLDRVQAEDIGLSLLEQRFRRLRPARVILVLVEQVTGHLTAQAVAARLQAIEPVPVDPLWLARDDESALVDALARSPL